VVALPTSPNRSADPGFSTLRLRLLICGTLKPRHRDKIATKTYGDRAVTKVGAASETELSETTHRVSDVRSAPLAAVEEGLVPNGGGALIDAITAPDAIRAQGEVKAGAFTPRRTL
jgi:hypothetical protein